MPLIKQIYEATKNRDLIEPFTTKDLKEWIGKNKIVKDDGSEYADSSINAILSNSDEKNTPTSNNNRKTLKSVINKNGFAEYRF